MARDDCAGPREDVVAATLSQKRGIIQGTRTGSPVAAGWVGATELSMLGSSSTRPGQPTKGDPPVAITLTGKTLTIEDIEAVARRGAKVELHADAIERIRVCRDFIEQRLAAHEIMYGVNWSRRPGRTTPCPLCTGQR